MLANAVAFQVVDGKVSGILYGDIFSRKRGFPSEVPTNQDHIDYLIENADWIDETFLLKDSDLDLSQYLRALPEELRTKGKNN